jgi:outer membrane protein OmpU
MAHSKGNDWKSCKTGPEKVKHPLYPFRILWFGPIFFQPEGKLMKNLLIATTALVATAGVAAADVSLSGAANFGIIATAEADSEMYNNVSVTAAMSGETDGGLTFGTSLTFRSGDDVDLDAGDITFDGDLSATSMGAITLGGDFGKLTFKANGVDNVHNDDYSHDVMYSGTFGALALTATANVESGPTVDGDSFSLKLAYSANGLSVTAKTDDGGESDTTIAYAVSDTLTASFNFDTDGQTSGSETTAKVAYSADGITASLAMMDDDANAWSLGLGYAANGMSVGVAIEDGGSEDLTASYDLGGGMSINAARNETGAFFIGSKMSF